MAQFNGAQQAQVLALISAAGDLPAFLQQSQAAFAANSKAPAVTALAGVVATVSDWTQFSSQMAIADPAVLMSLMTDIATNISGQNAITLGPQLALLYLVVKKYLGV